MKIYFKGKVRIKRKAEQHRRSEYNSSPRKTSYLKSALMRIFTAFLCLIGIFSVSCANTTTVNERDVLRLHIRADSNAAEDQEVKLKVRDKIIKYLADLDARSVKDAKRKVASKTNTLIEIANRTLIENGFSYKASATLKNEFFPTRSYGDVTLESGYYDALIISLGSGEGDNWWCVIYPPLCYLEGNGGVKYKSIIREWLGLS